MATIEIAERYPDRTALRLVVNVPDLLWVLVHRRAEQRMYRRLSRLSPHLIRDAGFDPDEVYDRMSGSWAEVNPGRYRGR